MRRIVKNMLSIHVFVWPSEKVRSESQPSPFLQIESLKVCKKHRGAASWASWPAVTASGPSPPPLASAKAFVTALSQLGHNKAPERIILDQPLAWN